MPRQEKGMLGKVGLVELISQSAVKNRQLSTIPLGSSAVLRFDLLESDFRYISMKILHCNADWSRSVLRDLEFLEVYNEFPVRDYNFSQTNYSDYTTYRAELPQLTKPGNYIFQVYDEDSDEILFNKRVSVYKTAMGINVSLERADNPSWRNSHHKIDYTINLMGLNVINPLQDLKVYVIQNNNWANLIEPIPPMEIDLGNGVISYTSYENLNSIPAINEFRFFDTRTISNRGLRVQDQYLIKGQPQVILEQDNSKFAKAYSEAFQEDFDGFFKIGNNDFLETSLNTEYVNVNFNLKSPPENGTVYVTGRFNNWEKNLINQMVYDSLSQSYKAKLLMKQGYYNYRYEIISQELDFYHFEGSHFQTRNTYEVYVYYREPGTVYDQLAGYKVFVN
ncbi:MAG: type IX secretion system plug protein domain-containing protein [Cyclobacteriaceae bacterium]